MFKKTTRIRELKKKLRNLSGEMITRPGDKIRWWQRVGSEKAEQMKAEHWKLTQQISEREKKKREILEEECKKTARICGTNLKEVYQCLQEKGFSVDLYSSRSTLSDYLTFEGIKIKISDHKKESFFHMKEGERYSHYISKTKDGKINRKW